jgi:two-component system, response regulator
MRILLVEDNPDDIKMTLRAIRRAHLASEVQLAEDGEAAVRILMDESQTLPDLVLLDNKLPKLTGLEVLDLVKTHPRTRRVPIVMLTSSDEERDLIDAYTKGANSYIQKPVEYDRFMGVVDKIGSYWLGLNMRPPLEPHADNA